LPLENKKRSKK